MQGSMLFLLMINVMVRVPFILKFAQPTELLQIVL